MGFRTALLAILSFFYSLPCMHDMHAVFWITLDILILFFALTLLPAIMLLLVLVRFIIVQSGVKQICHQIASLHEARSGGCGNSLHIRRPGDHCCARRC
jgi:hypothetical protein